MNQTEVLCGSRQRDAPMGLVREMKAAGVSKWRGLSRRDRAELDGELPDGGE